MGDPSTLSCRWPASRGLTAQAAWLEVKPSREPLQAGHWGRRGPGSARPVTARLRRPNGLKPGPHITSSNVRKAALRTFSLLTYLTPKLRLRSLGATDHSCPFRHVTEHNQGPAREKRRFWLALDERRQGETVLEANVSRLCYWHRLTSHGAAEMVLRCPERQVGKSRAASSMNPTRTPLARARTVQLLVRSEADRILHQIVLTYPKWEIPSRRQALSAPNPACQCSGDRLGSGSRPSRARDPALRARDICRLAGKTPPRHTSHSAPTSRVLHSSQLYHFL